MKKRLLFFMFMSWTILTYAQDVIVKKDGSTVLSKVIEIGTSEIKYKKWSNQDGPMYVITKDNVKNIIYENGDKEVLSDVNKPELGNSSLSAGIDLMNDCYLHEKTIRIWF